jgi:dephospho-CoA kinase
MIIGITGSFGSGKTTVANLFKRHGFAVINVDELYRGIYAKNKGLKNRIKGEFGTADRSQLKKIVFSDYKKLQKLNKLTHPLIMREIKKAVSRIKKSRLAKKEEPKIIIDAPLLFEANAYNIVGKVIVVKATKKNSIKRLLKKKYSRREIEQIMKSQMPLREKLKRADFIIDNNSSLKNTEGQVKKIIRMLNR